MRHSTQALRVWGLNGVIMLRHSAFIARVKNIAFSFIFHNMDTMNMQLGLELKINDTCNPSGTF